MKRFLTIRSQQPILWSSIFATTQKTAGYPWTVLQIRWSLFPSIKQLTIPPHSKLGIEYVSTVYVSAGRVIGRVGTCYNQKAHKLQRVCVLQHGECKRTAPRSGWKTISPKVKKAPLINLGCRNVSTCTESGAAHTSQSKQTALVQHTIALTQSYREFTQSIDNKTVLVCVCVCWVVNGSSHV